MLGFRQALLRKDFDKDYLYEKFSGVPSIVLDSLVSRFTEVSRGSTKCIYFYLSDLMYN
jgi:DNA-directed RNA polymerase I subunit RPA49